jgi:Ca2+-binding EF-hand superfamily protein
MLPITLFLLAAVLAQAQEGGRGPGRGGPPSPVMAALDTDRDGIISAAEIANSPAAVKKLDKNGDGQITPDEWRFGGDPRVKDAEQMLQSLMAFDADHDGKLSKSELPVRMQGLMDRADTNHDGFLTQDEIRKQAFADAEEPEAPRPDMVTATLDTNHDGIISAAEIANAPVALKALDKNSDGQLTGDELRPPQQGRGPGRGNPDEMISRLFTQFDKNNDGRISRDEAAGGPLEELFERADQNKDGFITRDELRTALQQRGGPNGPPERQ